MLYLLDANVLIDANRDYYPVERIPEFWGWLLEMGTRGRIKIPQEFLEEVIYPLPPDDRPDPLVENAGPGVTDFGATLGGRKSAAGAHRRRILRHD